MNTTANHMIKQATLEFQYNGKTDGLAFQQDVRDWFDEFIAKLNDEMNELSVDDQIISIDSLQLEVELSGTDWRQQASHKIMEQLKDRVRLIGSGVVSSTGYAEKTSIQHFAELFLHYLQNGSLPWYALPLSSEKWNQQVETLMIQADENFVQALKELLLQSNASRERLLQTVPFQTAVELFRSASVERPFIHQQLVHDLQLLMKIAIIHHYSDLKQVVYRAFLLKLSEKADTLQIKQELALSVHRKVLSNPAIVESIKNLQFQSVRLIALKNELTETEKKTKAKKEVRKYRQQKQLNEHEEFVHQQEGLQLLVNQPVFISNAGLVLVAAFLPALFEKTKLSADHQIQHAEKAVCFVQYLLTGNKNMQEYELVLPKILCGVAIDEPVDTGKFQVDKILKKEAEEVLTSVIEYWNILKNTSIDGLRESFLKRNGKLTYDGKDWLLQVEQQPYDMLLQHLPWNISMIKLAWMQQMLKTEWIY